MTDANSTSTAPIAALRAAVEAAAAALRGDAPAGAAVPTLARPPRADFGDYSTNAAMLLAPVLGEAPRAIAERLAGELAGRLGAGLERTEVAGPGFLNLFLADGWHVDALARVLAAGDGFGGGGAAPAERVVVEFVSSNPTGPLTAAAGRHAAYGDALARVLAFRGHEVSREYYLNDAGSQVLRLGESIQARARGEEVPEDGYAGDYVRGLADEIGEEARIGDPESVAQHGLELLLASIRATLDRFGVTFDTWFSERSLHGGAGSPIANAYAELEARGQTYWHEDALWLRSTALGDDKDRVLRRSSGEDTYFGADIAYHQNKRARGFERVIDVWGADHHGYVLRMQAAWQALGGDPAQFETVIMQFVNLVEQGERASMSKRRGDFVTLDDLIAEIGADAARFLMLQRSHDTTVDLDLDLARSQSSENPVYYVQYAHARIASVLAKAGGERVAAALAQIERGELAPGTEGAGAAVSGEPAAGGAGAPVSGDRDASQQDATGLHPAERALVKKLLAFPAEVADAELRRGPHRIAVYALELAQEFTAFYRDCHVVGAEPAAVESLRLGLCVATQRTIARALDLLGVSAPESM